MKRTEEGEREKHKRGGGIHHSNPDRPLIQLTDRETAAAGMICL